MATDPIRPTDDSARALARDLLRTARSGTLATLEAGAGPGSSASPSASLILMATDCDGTPLTLVSALSSHSRNLRSDPRAGLLLARSGKGDPLAHPRLSVQVEATWLDRASETGARARRRILARHPKAGLYVDFADFSLVALRVLRASLNGGFGRSYELEAGDLLLEAGPCAAIAAIEADVLAHMNDDHPETVARYAVGLLGAEAGPWRLTGLDPAGCDLVCNDAALRLAFPAPVHDAAGVHATLRSLADQARAG